MPSPPDRAKGSDLYGGDLNVFLKKKKKKLSLSAAFTELSTATYKHPSCPQSVNGYLPPSQSGQCSGHRKDVVIKSLQTLGQASMLFLTHYQLFAM